MNADSRHQCLIYDGPPTLQLPMLAAAIHLRLSDGYRCIYLNSRPMVTFMQTSLTSCGIDVDAEVARGSLILSSEPCVTATGDFDIDAMLDGLESTVHQALSDGYKRLWVTGDMTWEFGDRKNLQKLMEYEWRLEKMFHKHEALCGLCQYHRDTLPHETMQQGLLSHRALFFDERNTRPNPHYVASGQLRDQRVPNDELDEMISGLCRVQN